MRIFRISNILFLSLATAFGVLLFWTSQAVQDREDHLSDVRKSLAHERETVKVLSVEWDYLNRPQRLEKLAGEQLGMQLPSAGEVVRGVDEIPEPLIVNADDAYLEEGVQPASFELVAASPAPPARSDAKREVVAPSQAEKQSFDRLIGSLNADAGE